MASDEIKDLIWQLSPSNVKPFKDASKSQATGKVMHIVHAIAVVTADASKDAALLPKVKPVWKDDLTPVVNNIKLPALMMEAAERAAAGDAAMTSRIAKARVIVERGGVNVESADKKQFMNDPLVLWQLYIAEMIKLIPEGDDYQKLATEMEKTGNSPKAKAGASPKRKAKASPTPKAKAASLKEGSSPRTFGT